MLAPLCGGPRRIGVVLICKITKAYKGVYGIISCSEYMYSPHKEFMVVTFDTSRQTCYQCQLWRGEHWLHGAALRDKYALHENACTSNLISLFELGKSLWDMMIQTPELGGKFFSTPNCHSNGVAR